MIRHLIVCMVYIAFGTQFASAQEQAPKPPADEKYARLLQALLDLDAKVERQNELHEQDIADRQHQEAQLREECAALKAKIERLEQVIAIPLDTNAELREINDRLAATRTIRVGLLRRPVSVYQVTGAERQRLKKRQSELQQHTTQAFIIGYIHALGIGLATTSSNTATPFSMSIFH